MRCSISPQVVVVFHGGWWKPKWTIDTAWKHPIAEDLCERLQVATIDVEYRHREDAESWRDQLPQPITEGSAGKENV